MPDTVTNAMTRKLIFESDMLEHSGKAHRDSDYTIMTIVNN